MQMQHKLVVMPDLTVLGEVFPYFWHIYLFLLFVLKTEKKMNMSIMRYNNESYFKAKVGCIV
jgi:hypothetical protein